MFHPMVVWCICLSTESENLTISFKLYCSSMIPTLLVFKNSLLPIIATKLHPHSSNADHYKLEPIKSTRTCMNLENKTLETFLIVYNGFIIQNSTSRQWIINMLQERNGGAHYFWQIIDHQYVVFNVSYHMHNVANIDNVS